MEERLIGQYRVTGILGEGGMGVVYAAEHTLFARSVAVKVLQPRFSGEPKVVQRFFNEARAATAIQHPGIVEIYDVGWTSDGAAFIVMEHLCGETLRARHKRGPLPWSTALALVRQIAGALGAAHATGIVHRDLKPDNVFLVPDSEVLGGERIKLLDFGIAKLVGAVSPRHETQTGALLGTPTYMSPEQCRGIAVDARADLYSLGCILFELCTGRPPFVGEGSGDVLAAHIYLAPPTVASLIGGVPEEIEALLRRMLAKSPAERVQTADELIRLIDATKAAITQGARADPRLVATPVISLPDVATNADHTEPIDASRFDTTLSSASGAHPRARTRSSARRSAILGGVGGLAILGAIAASFTLFRGGEAGDTPIRSTSSPPNAESVDTTTAPPALTVTPAGPSVTPLQLEAAPPPATPPRPLEAAPPPATPPRPLEPAAASAPSAPKRSTRLRASASAASPSPAQTSTPQAPPVRSARSQATEVTISLQSVPSGAVISRGGDFLGMTPQDVQIKRGDYEFKFELRLPGHQTYELVVRPISSLQRTVKLKRLPSPRSWGSP
ncbi:MAG TPA: serine/threonine-protein kinase [Kofleriaceae bacterium]|nr:serine/threonine-protein kinase [Kofleriaceae bacterium]